MEATSRHRPALRLARPDAPRAPGPRRPEVHPRREAAELAVGPMLLMAMHEDRGPVWVLSLSGEADLYTQGLLEAELDTAVSMRKESLVLDVRRLSFCDVACAQRVLAATRTASAVLVGATGEVKRVFELLDADEDLPRRARSRSWTRMTAAVPPPRPGRAERPLTRLHPVDTLGTTKR